METGRAKWYASLKRRKPLYAVWNAMTQRCHNPKHHKYPTYGARGITVCERWLGENGYENFEADMAPRPSMLHTIDRIKNDLGYFKDNCRWATRSEQQRNRRVNVMVTIGARTQCQKAWADEVGIRISTFRRRMELGWTGENLLQPPDQKFNRMARRNP